MANKDSPRLTCPVCGKDCTPEPGKVYRCDEKQCPFWRVAF